jgi:acyl carrier protein
MENKILYLLTRIRPEFDFRAAADFIEEGMLDSFDMITLVEELDREYGISIDGIDIVPENFASVGAILAVLLKNGARE